ncbi:MAG: site-2 protease family protein [candidate division WOR-3 bacterium]
MESLHKKIEELLQEVLEIEASKTEHFSFVLEGKLKIPEEEALKYIKEKVKLLDFFVSFRRKGEGISLTFIPLPEKKERKDWINFLLLIMTFITTLIAGALQLEVNPFSPIFNIIKGIPFSLSIMLIIGSHELGHYLLARKNNVDASLPYFIPAPHLIGTFGAIIKMRSPIKDRNSLIEIGAGGPIIGFIVSTIVLLIGLHLSEPVSISDYKGGLTLGDSILIKLFTRIYFHTLPEGKDISLHPIAFAGWIGYFITALNLLPVGQLDGGHILYALINEKSKIVGWIVFGIAILLSFFWIGWIVWAILFLVIGFKHPSPLDTISPLSKKHKIIALISFLILILTFVPTPFLVK